MFCQTKNHFGLLKHIILISLLCFVALFTVNSLSEDSPQSNNKCAQIANKTDRAICEYKENRLQDYIPRKEAETPNQNNNDQQSPSVTNQADQQVATNQQQPENINGALKKTTPPTLLNFPFKNPSILGQLSDTPSNTNVNSNPTTQNSSSVQNPPVRQPILQQDPTKAPVLPNYYQQSLPKTQPNNINQSQLSPSGTQHVNIYK